jgi:hypothetical protein
MAILSAIAGLFPIVAFVQQTPADGSFLLVCTFYGESNQGERAWNRQQYCQLPPDFPLDDLYRQQTVYSSGGGASSNIQFGQIPPGIHLDVSGGHFWSVNNPISLSQPDSDGKRTFTIETYCGPEPAPGPGCNVKVNVFARRRQTWSPDQPFYGWSSIYNRNRVSTVFISVESDGNTPNYGSGVVLGSGKVLTAKHLLPPANAIRNRKYLIRGLVDWEKPSLEFSTAYELKIDSVSKHADFAVLSFVGKSPGPSQVFFEPTVQTTEPVLILAYPGGSKLMATNAMASGDATEGKFAVNVNLGAGSSGGPVFSPGGGLVGIVVQGPASSDPAKLAFFLGTSAILADHPELSSTAAWPALPTVRSDHVDTLSMTTSPSTPAQLDFNYPVVLVSTQKQGRGCCEFSFQAQRGMKITQAHFVPSAKGDVGIHRNVTISENSETVTLLLPASARFGNRKYLGHLWTHQIGCSR